MSSSATQDQWLNTVMDQLRALGAVACEPAEDGRAGLTASHDGDSRDVFFALPAADYRTLKIQYRQLRKALRELGIGEGETFTAAPPPARPMTPQMRAARAERKATFEAWQELWRTIRKAEKALDVAYEITQMKDYY